NNCASSRYVGEIALTVQLTSRIVAPRTVARPVSLNNETALRMNGLGAGCRPCDLRAGDDREVTPLERATKMLSVGPESSHQLAVQALCRAHRAFFGAKPGRGSGRWGVDEPGQWRSPNPLLARKR